MTTHHPTGSNAAMNDEDRKLVERLREAAAEAGVIASDPMWAHHCEVNKRTVQRYADAMSEAARRIESGSTGRICEENDQECQYFCGANPCRVLYGSTAPPSPQAGPNAPPSAATPAQMTTMSGGESGQRNKDVSR